MNFASTYSTAGAGVDDSLVAKSLFVLQAGTGGKRALIGGASQIGSKPGNRRKIYELDRV